MRIGPTLSGTVTALAAAMAAWGLAAFIATLEGRPLELGDAKALALDPELERSLTELDGTCHATYYVSSPDQMPSELRRLEAEVTDVLVELRRASNGRFDFDVLDPAAEPELAPWIAHQGIAPFRARSVRHDAWSETEVHSTLALSYAGHGRARIAGLRPEHVPTLGKLVQAHLEEMDAPSTPSFTLAGAHTDSLAARLGKRGKVTIIDFDASPGALPNDADLFFWIAPSTAGPEHTRALDLFLEEGGSVVLAGSTHQLTLDTTVVPPSLTRAEATQPIALVAAELGLQALPDMLFDPLGDRLRVSQRMWSAPWRTRSVAPNQDFRPLGRQPNGTLFFDSPTAWSADPVRLDERGYDVHVLATSSADSYAQPFDERIPIDAITPEAGRSIGKASIAVLSVPRDPWRGQVALFGSASPFQDEKFEHDDFAHGELADVLAAGLASTEGRVLRRARPATRTPLPALEPGARIGWRLVAIGALPLALGLIALARRQQSKRRGTRRAQSARGRQAPFALAALVLATLVIGVLAPWFDGGGWRADWTRDDVHELAPATLAAANQLDVAVRAELAFSSPLPPPLRVGLSRLRSRLRDLERNGLDLDVTTISVDDLDLEQRRALTERGLRPLRVARRNEAGASVRTLYAALALETDDHRTLLEFPNELSFERLEFRLATALWTLARGRAPRVAFAADLPQLTPAEAHVEYRQKGLFAPGGSDVYGAAKELLRLAGFEVVHVDPRAPAPFDPTARPDLLIWMQPRRSIEPMLALFVEHLRSGGKAALLAQHFVLRSRQPQDAGLEIRHWPEPKFTDLEQGWLADLGIELERSVLFDRRNGALTITSNVERADGSQARERGAAIQPYLIRAVADSWSDDAIVKRLGDVLFASASRLVLDPDRLAQNGLAARTLATTSEDAWTYQWSGGDLPIDVLEGPEPSGTRTPHAPLWVEVTGSFPALASDSFAVPARAGRLAIVGSSQPFENELLFAEDYDHTSLFLNLVADLSLGPELGAVAARRSVPRGFSPPDDTARLTLRASVLALGPVGFLLIGLLRRHRRSSARSSR